MGTLNSGLLRQRFRLVMNSGLEPPGFIYDYSRMPGQEIDRGCAVTTGAFWDGDNSALQDQFHLILSGTTLIYNWDRSNWTPGLKYLVGGIGDNDDLEFSGILVSGSNWWPQVEPGVYFDLDTQYYLYSQDAIEFIYSGTSLQVPIAIEPENYKPITVSTYFIDDWGRARPYEFFAHKHSFTPINSGVNTLTATSGTDPELFEPTYNNVIWANVNTSGFEFILDIPYSGLFSGIILNQLINSGVEASLQRVPWSPTYIQLPLVPFVSMSGIPVFQIYEDIVYSSNGVAYPTLGSYQMTDLLVTLSGYTRVSGNWDELSGILPAYPDPSGFPAGGSILIDDGDYRQETIDYLSISGIYFSGLTRATPVVHRDGAQIRLITTSGSISGVTISGLPDGDYLANYKVSGLTYTIDANTGLMSVPVLSGIGRVITDLVYYRGLSICYEPSGNSNDYTFSGINLNPLIHGNDNGILWLSMYPLHPAKIQLEPARGINTDGTVGPVYAGNDFLVLNAKVINHYGAPIPNTDVVLVLETPTNAGLVNTEDPSQEFITKRTDGTGTARFVYTPPDSINGLGYFIPSGNLVGSGLTFYSPVPIEELWDEGGYKCLLFSVANDDYYTPYSETSGLFDFSADGRFELVTVISGISPTSQYRIWKPLEPTALLDANGAAVTASGSRISTITFPAAGIPTDSNISSYFISVEKRLSIGAFIEGSNVASKSLEVVIGIPGFMTGDFLFGPIDDPETSAFDSMAYITINPFDRIDPEYSRSDPRLLGNVFRITGSAQNLLRNKFYLGIDYDILNQTQTGRNEIRKIHNFRNRFIIEI